MPATARERVSQVEEEPDDLNSERLVSRKNGNGEKIYRFMLSSYDPALLLIYVSKHFPRLCFILGCVAPNIDEAASKFITNGKARRYTMSSKRRREIRVNKYNEWGEDCLDADIEADWVMLDAVVARWNTKFTTALKAVKTQKSRL